MTILFILPGQRLLLLLFFLIVTLCLAISPASDPKPPETFRDGLEVPALMVFDLDDTLWPNNHDRWAKPPTVIKFPPRNHAAASWATQPQIEANKLNSEGRLEFDFEHSYDFGQEMPLRWFYSEVPTILAAARDKGITLAISSLNEGREFSKYQLKRSKVPGPPDHDGNYKWDQRTEVDAISLFEDKNVIILGRSIDWRLKDKVYHLKKLKQANKVAFDDMIFFDDRNGHVVEELKGLSYKKIRPSNGLTSKVVDDAIRAWRVKREQKRKQEKEQEGKQKGEQKNKPSKWKFGWKKAGGTVKRSAEAVKSQEDGEEKEIGRRKGRRQRVQQRMLRARRMARRRRGLETVRGMRRF